MSKLFILGAGFSKAVSHLMPTLYELSREAVDWDMLPIEIPEHSNLRQDVEQLLTYFHSEMPWKSPEEFHLGKAAFFSITKQLTAHIEAAEEKVFQTEPPSWIVDFVRYLHEKQCVVATLNYDTIVERIFCTLLGKENKDFQSDSHLYQLTLVALLGRTVSLVSGSPLDTFRLLKLHGSTHWYSSGEENVVGQQVYYESLHYKIFPDGQEKGRSNVNKKDLIPLIIPPVAEKSAFYRTRLIRTLWTDFREAIEAATEIYCVGYSLPKTDLTMNLFLSSTASTGKTVYLVNRSTDKNLEINYQQVFGNCEIDTRYLGHNDAVERMVNDLISTTEAVA